MENSLQYDLENNLVKELHDYLVPLNEINVTGHYQSITVGNREEYYYFMKSEIEDVLIQSGLIVYMRNHGKEIDIMFKTPGYLLDIKTNNVINELKKEMYIYEQFYKQRDRLEEKLKIFFEEKFKKDPLLRCRLIMNQVKISVCGKEL